MGWRGRDPSILDDLPTTGGMHPDSPVDNMSYRDIEPDRATLRTVLRRRRKGAPSGDSVPRPRYPAGADEPAPVTRRPVARYLAAATMSGH